MSKGILPRTPSSREGLKDVKPLRPAGAWLMLKDVCPDVDPHANSCGNISPECRCQTNDKLT